jgi:hypothetical protein
MSSIDFVLQYLSKKWPVTFFKLTVSGSATRPRHVYILFLNWPELVGRSILSQTDRPMVKAYQPVNVCTIGPDAYDVIQGSAIA